MSCRWFALFISVLAAAILHLTSKNENTINSWQSSLPKGKGVITNLFMSAQKLHYTAPKFAENADYFLRQKKIINTTSVASQPDIIAFLQESTVNPSLYTIPGVVLPTFDMFSGTAPTKASSLLRVQTFGGGTWLSEFSFLTGLNSDDFQFNKNAVFYTVAPHIQNSIFKELKNNGYFTVVLTPMNQGNYNAGKAYQHFGIDLILQPQQLGYPADLTANLWDISTKNMLNYVKKILAIYTNKPIFIYVLSMNEHGPYKTNYSDDQHHIAQAIGNMKITSTFNHYLSKIKLLNEATQDFTNYVMARKKPTIFLYFGDHQPSIGWQGGYNTSLVSAKTLTQFYLQDNLTAPSINDMGELTDISFLSGLLLERAGLKMSPFFEANIWMRHLCQGKLSDCQDQRLVNSYKHYLYQVLKSAE